MGPNLSLMASKHFVPILLLLVFLVPHIGHGARYRFRDLTPHSKEPKNDNHPKKMAGASLSATNIPSFDYPLFASLPKATPPIPPSGPSHRHNRHFDGGVHKGSAKAREKDLS
jgi:hypothetical protein